MACALKRAGFLEGEAIGTARLIGPEPSGEHLWHQRVAGADSDQLCGGVARAANAANSAAGLYGFAHATNLAAGLRDSAN